MDEEERLLPSVPLQDARSDGAERERLDQLLSEERELLRITLSSIGDAVITTDAEGRVLYLNKIAEELTGFREGDAVGRPLPDVFRIVDEETREASDNPALRALAQGQIVRLSNRTLLIARDGTERPIDDSVAPLRSASGKVLGAVLVFRDVSERRRGEEARAQLAAIVESSEDAIVTKTLDGIIRSWNAGAERIFGYNHVEAVGKHITFFIPSELVEEEQNILARLRRGERVEHFETIRLAKDGRRLDISLTVSPVKDSQGRITGASKVARDITERKRASEALSESERHSRFLLKLAAVIQRLSDPKEVMSEGSRLLSEHLHLDGCAFAEVEEDSVFVFSNGYSRDAMGLLGRLRVAEFGAECERLIRGHEPFVLEAAEADGTASLHPNVYQRIGIQSLICVPLTRDGVLSAAMAVHQKARRVWRSSQVELVRTVASQCWESIERTRAARSLKRAGERLAVAVEAANLGDWSWEPVSDTVTLSARAAEIYGVSLKQHLTREEMMSIVHPEDRDRLRLEAERVVSETRRVDLEYRVVRPGGNEAWVSAKGRVHQDAHGLPLEVVGVVQDITEKKHLEQQLTERARELEEADRKKDDFIALLAHELRNPLAPLRTAVQVMKLAPGDVKAEQRTVDMMDRQLGHMVRLIDDLLDVSRINRNKLRLQKIKVSLADVVAHALETVSPLIEARGHRLVVSLPSETVTLDGDLTRLAQVFGNLLTNSAKYTSPGGTIWLTAELIRDQVAVFIKDTGLGIPHQALPHIFEMFSQVERTTERSSEGLGIGLALVKGLVEAHGGTVSAESPGPGGGSTFVVRLPLVAMRAAEQSAPAKSESSTVSPGGRKVLVADDNRDGASTLAELLTLLGNVVHVVHDGKEAVEQADRIRPDLVLMDVGMPLLDGLDATRRIREQPWGKAITIIALTGWGQHADRERSRAAGCDGHLVKPVGLAELQRVLADRRR